MKNKDNSKEFNKVFRQFCKHFGHNWRVMRNKILSAHKEIDKRFNAERSGSF